MYRFTSNQDQNDNL